jgi:DMSO/TMAO reductase YedYZ molybdopterin-dependent catalytic subunit
MAITTSPQFTREEVGLALRNPGMPLEGLRYPITPIGMHYVLVHFDVPHVDAASYRLLVDGLVRRALSLTLEDLRSRPAVSMPVMMECAGSGRARLMPRPVSAPWHDEAIGCAEWTGTPLRGILETAGLIDDAVELLFTGCDRGIDQGVEQDYQRSLPVEEALGDDVLLAYAMNGQPLPPAHGFPVRLIVPDWYGMAPEVVAVDHCNRPAIRGRSANRLIPLSPLSGGPGLAGHPQETARVDDTTRHSGVPLTQPPHACRSDSNRGPGMVRVRRGHPRRVQRRRRAHMGRGAPPAHGRQARLERLEV